MKRTLIALIGLLGGCLPSVNRYALGGEREIIVFYDENTKNVLHVLDSLINKAIYTPQPDSFYHIKPVPPDSYDVYKGYKNILVLAYDGSEASSLFEHIIDGKEGLFTARKVFSPDDFVLILSRQTPQDLLYDMPFIYRKVDSTLRERVYELYRRRAFYVGRNKKIEEKIRKKYGLDMQVPLGWYFIKGTENQDSILFLGKHNPDRFVFVYKTHVKYPLDRKTILDLRNRIAQVYYPGDYVLEEYIVEEKPYGMKEALCLYSVWQNDKEIAGGPLKTCAYYYGDYFIMYDIGVFAPRQEDKLQYILRAETFIKTLKPLD